MSTGTPVPMPVITVAAASDPERQRLEARARRLTKLGLGWHLLEAAVAVGAGLVAGSVALIGFGADTLIELAASLVVLWLVTGERLRSTHLERRARQLIEPRLSGRPRPVGRARSCWI